jgi:dipeptidyl aminopeptidase/acylaminoacyl peptidase
MMAGFITLENLISLPIVDSNLGFELSPDGNFVAYSSNSTGQWEIYILELEPVGDGRQITFDHGSNFSPRWFPDGHKLAYVKDLNGAEDYDIWEYDFVTQKHRNMTPDTPEALSSFYAWSPDGHWIAYCSNLAGGFDTYIMPADGGDARLVLNTPNQDWEIAWSPDSRFLAVTSEAEGSDFWTYIVPLDGGKAKSIELDGSPICSKDATWAPDGTKVAFSSDYHGSFNIAIYDIRSDQITWLDLGEGEIESPDWSTDGSMLTAVVSHGAKTHLIIYKFDEKSVKTFQHSPGVVFSPVFTKTGDEILFVFNSPRYPDNLWMLSIAEGFYKQLTSSITEDAHRRLLSIPEEITYPGLDGIPVPALLYRPQTQKDELPPGVLTIHGGPNWLTQITWDPFIQDMVNRGWVVLAPNYRGSTGYGRKWQLASRFDLGGVDTEDVVAGANYLNKQGIAAPDRIAVTGRSWGGYLTMTCLTQYPEIWAVGSASVPFLNWFTSHENSRVDLQHWDRENFGNPDDNYDLWYERSPYFFMDKIKAPVQLICGAHDVRCPASEAQQAYQELIKLGLECEYLVFEDEGHAFLKLDNQIKAKQSRIDFLAAHLEPKK